MNREFLDKLQPSLGYQNMIERQQMFNGQFSTEWERVQGEYYRTRTAHQGNEEMASGHK
jgi:hypothetical protein